MQCVALVDSKAERQDAVMYHKTRQCHFGKPAIIEQTLAKGK